MPHDQVRNRSSTRARGGQFSACRVVRHGERHGGYHERGPPRPGQQSRQGRERDTRPLIGSRRTRSRLDNSRYAHRSTHIPPHNPPHNPHTHWAGTKCPPHEMTVIKRSWPLTRCGRRCSSRVQADRSGPIATTRKEVNEGTHKGPHGGGVSHRGPRRGRVLGAISPAITARTGRRRPGNSVRPLATSVRRTPDCGHGSGARASCRPWSVQLAGRPLPSKDAPESTTGQGRGLPRGCPCRRPIGRRKLLVRAVCPSQRPEQGQSISPTLVIPARSPSA
jgi:hypothetical protein